MSIHLKAIRCKQKRNSVEESYIYHVKCDIQVPGFVTICLQFRFVKILNKTCYSGFKMALILDRLVEKLK